MPCLAFCIIVPPASLPLWGREESRHFPIFCLSLGSQPAACTFWALVFCAGACPTPQAAWYVPHKLPPLAPALPDCMWRISELVDRIANWVRERAAVPWRWVPLRPIVGWLVCVLPLSLPLPRSSPPGDTGMAFTSPSLQQLATLPNLPLVLFIRLPHCRSAPCLPSAAGLSQSSL